jgi:drug/metabolite transporter (DMT)-like permease
VVEPLLPADGTPPREPHPFVGYAMVLTAATLWAVNGAVSKVILDSGVSSLRLSEVRSTGAFVGLALVLVLLAPRRLRVSRGELPMLALFGIAGLAFV